MIKSFLSLLNAISYFHCGFLIVYFINIDYWTGYTLPICVGVIQIFHVYRFKNTNEQMTDKTSTAFPQLAFELSHPVRMGDELVIVTNFWFLLTGRNQIQ